LGYISNDRSRRRLGNWQSSKLVPFRLFHDRKQLIYCVKRVF
jgi:hypothetical protein